MAPRIVTVIGNGLSGITATLSLIDRKQPVTWISQKNAPISTNWPESIQLSGLQSLSSIIDIQKILSHCVIPISTHFSCWGSPFLKQEFTSLNSKNPKKLLLIDKHTLINELNKELHSLDALSIPRRVKKVIKGKQCFELTLNDGSSLKSDVLIDATGSNSDLTKGFTERFRLDQFHVLCWQLQDAHASSIKATFLEATASGWWYAAPRLKGGLALFFATDLTNSQYPEIQTPQFITKELNKTIHLKHWIKELRLCNISKPIIRNHSLYYKRIKAEFQKKSEEESLFLTGDVAMCVDPLSSHGSTNAIWSSLQVAESIDTQPHQQFNHEYQNYGQLIHRAMIHHLENRRKIYQQESRFKEYPFWVSRSKHSDLESMQTVELRR